MSETDSQIPVSELSFEQAREQLVSAIGQLEAGKLGLEESLEVWQRGEELAKHCQAFLDRAKARLDQVKQAD